MGCLSSWAASVHRLPLSMVCLSSWAASVHGLPQLMGRLNPWVVSVHGPPQLSAPAAANRGFKSQWYARHIPMVTAISGSVLPTGVSTCMSRR